MFNKGTASGPPLHPSLCGLSKPWSLGSGPLDSSSDWGQGQGSTRVGLFAQARKGGGTGRGQAATRAAA